MNNVKYNINKIHGNLLSLGDVKIEEKSNLKFGSHFEINAIKDNMNIRMIISKRDLESTVFKWSYYANPLNESSDLVERVSSVDNIQEHISDVISNKRFNKEYLSEISGQNN